jgi:putative membrane protein
VGILSQVGTGNTGWLVRGARTIFVTLKFDGGSHMQVKVPELKGSFEKAIYVASVTTLFTFLGCWGVLAHSSGAARRSSNDELFSKKAAQGGIAEVKMGKLAADKSSNEAVKKFGRRMVEDHTKAGDDLKEAARKEGISLPQEMDAKEREAFDRLSKLSGAEFDKAYAQDMVKDHQEDIAEFTSEANGGHKDAIRSFASDTLPTLKDHLKLARAMRQSTMSRTVKPVVTKAPAVKKSVSHGGR